MIRRYTDENDLINLKEGIKEYINSVVDKLSANIRINIFPITSGLVAFLTHENGQIILQQESDESGVIIFNVDEVGKYTLTFENEYVSSEVTTVTVDSSKKARNIIANYNPPVVYTLAIDLTDSNPSRCCTYEDDAANMLGEDAADNASIFNDIKPCVFKNGKVQYYLKRNDFTIKEDGSPSNIIGGDGDVMIEIPQFGYRIYTRTEAKEIATAEDGSTTLSSTADKLIVQVTNNTKVFKDIKFIGNVAISIEEYVIVDDETNESLTYYYIVNGEGVKLQDASGEYITTQNYTVSPDGYLRNNLLPDYFVAEDMSLYDGSYNSVNIYHQDTDSNGNITQSYYNLVPQYKRYAFTKILDDGTEEVVDKIYIGAYHATYNDSTLKSALKSVVTATAIASDASGYKAATGTFDKMKSLAETSGYHMWNYQQVVMLQCLYLVRYKNLNSQTALGLGYTGASSSAVRTVGSTATSPMFYGTTDKNKSIKFCGIEDFWGHFHQWVDGIGIDKKWNIVYDGCAPLNTTVITTLAGDASLFPKTVLGTTEGGFICNSTTAGSSSTYWCDKQGVSNGSYAVAEDGTVSGALYRFTHGGTSNGSTNAGAFYNYTNEASKAYSTRLMWW